MLNYFEIGQRIRHSRKAQGLSQEHLAERVGITLANMSVLKNGKARAVKISTLQKLCQALDCQPGDLLEYRKNAE